MAVVDALVFDCVAGFVVFVVDFDWVVWVFDADFLLVYITRVLPAVMFVPLRPFHA